MHPEFWLERWQLNQIGFHQETFNSHLERYWPLVRLSPGQTVLVPLCGKSLDLLWLAAQGYRVVGAEISPLAVQTFFAENRLQARRRALGSFEAWEYGEISILLGDFFQLSSMDLGVVAAVYDRASLIALPKAMRASYVEHLWQLTGPGTASLLITLDYPQEAMEGPPFAVSDEEVRTLYQDRYVVEELSQCDVLDENPKFRERGLEYLYERVYRLTSV